MPRAPLSGELAKPTGFDWEVFPGQSSVKAAVQVLLSAEDVSRKALCEYRFNQRSTGDSPAAVVLLLDIPRGWRPRAKQQPTGLIACGAAHRRPVQVLLSADRKFPKGLRVKEKRQPFWKLSFKSADKRTWTSTELPRLEPESNASANSAISAYSVGTDITFSVRFRYGIPTVFHVQRFLFIFPAGLTLVRLSQLSLVKLQIFIGVIWAVLYENSFCS